MKFLIIFAAIILFALQFLFQKEDILKKVKKDFVVLLFPSVTKPATYGDKMFEVVRVIDGDTIVVSQNDIEFKVRLIGIDTPETVDPRKIVQCFGKEASDKTKQILINQNVRLEADPSQQNKDKYGRLLRFVFLPDGTNVNKMLIEEGYAHEYTYDIPYKYQQEFIEAQRDARNAEKGLWNSAVCPNR